MALSLPNNYTEYVPLDILLAEQLNNDNTNNQFIANQFPISSANIDWSSIKATSQPIISQAVSLGYGQTGVPLVRQGNLVTIAFTTVPSENIPSNYLQLGETIPAGFRPSSEYTDGAIIQAQTIDGASTNIGFAEIVQSNGSIALCSPISIAQGTRITYTAAWFTDDDWPTQS